MCTKVKSFSLSSSLFLYFCLCFSRSLLDFASLFLHLPLRVCGTEQESLNLSHAITDSMWRTLICVCVSVCVCVCERERERDRDRDRDRDRARLRYLRVRCVCVCACVSVCAGVCVHDLCVCACTVCECMHYVCTRVCVHVRCVCFVCTRGLSFLPGTT